MRIVVVGAGVVGATLAWELSERGHEVVIIERGSAVGHETSFANGGQLHAGHAAPWNAPGVLRDAIAWLGRADSPLRIHPGRLLRAPLWAVRFLAHANAAGHLRHARANSALAAHSLHRMRQLDAVPDPAYAARACGILKLFDDTAALDRGAAAAAAVADLGVRYRVLDREQCVACEPSLAEGSASLAGAIEFPDDGCGDALRFTAAITERAVANGAELRLNTTIDGVTGDTQRVTGVASSTGAITADHVVIAAGSYSPTLVRRVGIRLPIEPIKGYSVTLPLRGISGAPERAIIDDARKIVLTRLGEHLRIAGKAEIAGFDLRAPEARCRAVRDQGLWRFPQLATALADAPLEAWSGLRPMTCDGPPLFGPTAVPGLHLATGVGHLGWTFAAAGAELVADQIEGRQCAIDPQPYLLERYRHR